MFHKLLFGFNRSPKKTKKNPLIRIQMPGLTLDIDREAVKTIVAIWPFLMQCGRRSLPWMMWVMTPLLTALWFGMNEVGANIQDKLCQQQIRDTPPMIAEDISPQQQGLQN